MKKTILVAGLVMLVCLPQSAQVEIVRESFGSTTWEGHPPDYPGYTSDAVFSGDSAHLFQVAGSSGYPAASGGTAVLMGSWSGPFNTEFVMQYSTEEYTGVRLGFGLKHNSNGWGTCQLTNNFTKIEYSTDSAAWTVIDKAALMEGSTWPCADDQVWAYVELAEVLPSSPTLTIRFTHTDPDIHPYYLDDITLTGYLPDLTPPTAPTSLAAEETGINGFILIWNAADDENGIDRYDVYKDGHYLLSVTDTMARIGHQMAGSTAAFSVVAYDIADNASPESDPLEVTLLSRPGDYRYAWESPQVKILPGGNMEWQPEPFEFTPGESLRYIDYNGGSDSSDGLTRSTPWKHHPWDPAASENAASCEGIHTYVFKRGAVYRGVLDARESGSPLEPIRLTSDPSWGDGPAYFFGSRRINGGWMRADASTAPDITDPQKVWYIDIDLPETKMICEMDGDELRQLHVARSPNYRYTPEDPLKTWWTWTGKSAAGGSLWLSDRNNLVQEDPDYYKGATVFSQEDAIVMCTVWKQEVEEWDPQGHRVKVSNTDFGGIGSHYFIENTPFLLDTTNEFYYDKAAKRLFVRLEGDKDPNTAVIEVATRAKLIDIASRHDIEISGLSFGVTTAHTVRYNERDAASTIRITGISNHIDIHHNVFRFVNGGISVKNAGSAAVNTHSISVRDNDFSHIGDLAVVFATDNAYMDNVRILRNRIFRNGYRHQGRWYSSIPAIYGQLNYGEVAGNVIDESWGNGIDMFWGKGSGSDAHIPFIRGMIYQNKATNTLIGTNDYGGIESWQGGPVFCYNNLSHNASGYKHYNNSSIGYAYYFDGSFKHMVFNNIASGVSHNRNAASIMQVLGFYNIYAHNTGYNTGTLFNAWKGTLALNGHNTYLANLGEDVEWYFRHEIDPQYIPFESYGFNIKAGTPFKGTLEDREDALDLGGFRGTLEEYRSQLTQTGWETDGEVLSNAEATDFRPLRNSTAIGKGVRFFTAFPLSRVVGEWHFYRHPADSTLIVGDNFYMTGEFNDRTTYKDVPKNHLQAHRVTDSSFVDGLLEDWTRGALEFDGTSVYCSIDHAAASATTCNDVDMTVNDFIIEVWLKTDTGFTDGAIVSKYGGSSGYELDITDQGSVRITLYESGSAAAALTSPAAINDGSWHHILAEVDRRSGIRLFVDGEASGGTLTGAMPDPGASLSNTSDLLVGRDAGGRHFKGTLDFLRLSKGTLFDARTTLGELYAWQTGGPFLYDLAGNAPVEGREAGALETPVACELAVSRDTLHFGNGQSALDLTVSATGGFTLRDRTGDFFFPEILGDTLRVDVQDNPGLDTLRGSFTVVGCSQTRRIQVIQDGSPCRFACDADTLEFSAAAESLTIGASTNGDLSVSSTAGFVSAALSGASDSISVQVAENPSSEARTAGIHIESCAGTHTVTVIQAGAVTGTSADRTDVLRVYPNPVSGNLLHLELPADQGELAYRISDLAGRPLLSGTLYPGGVSIPLDLEPGSYYLRISGNGSGYEKVLIVMEE